jgi:hypothetical protein
VKKYSYLPGFLLVVAAAIRAALDGAWDPVAIGMAAGGGVVIALSIAWNRVEVMEWIRDPRGVFAVTTGISVVALVMVLVLVNILVWYRPWRVDLTASGRNVTTPETQALLQGLDTDVVFRQFGRAPDPQVDQRLSSFAGASRRIRVEFTDAAKNPQLAREYGVIKDGTVIVETAGRHRKVEDPTEAALVTAVLQVTSADERTVCFVTGHGERGLADESAGGLSRLSATLTAANYGVERVSLLEGDVPERCSVVVIPGPREPLGETEIKRMDRYASAGGRLAVMVDPDPSEALSAWLTPFGIEPEAGLIVDASGAGRQVGTGPEVPLAFAYGNHPITRGFEVATMFDKARSLKVAERGSMGGTPVAVASTSEKSFVTTERTGNGFRVDPARDRRGPFTLVAATSIKTAGGARPEELRLVVFGDADFVTDAHLGRQGNRDLFLRTIAWLAGEEEATIVSVEGHENRRIELTERSKAWMYLVNVLFLPLIPLTVGIIAFLRAKR